jgi:hypothetical protein
MGVIPAVILLSLLLPQAPPAAANAVPKGAGKTSTAAPTSTQQAPAKLGVEFDPATGWPRTSEVAPKPEGETKPAALPTRVAGSGATSASPAPTGGNAAAVRSAVPASTLVAPSKTDLAALGVVALRWRVSVHGPDGNVFGTRELEQLSDFETPDRDRLDLADGAVYGRCGSEVAAQRHGSPWPLLVPVATQDLQLYGLHARLPWVFADRNAFDALSSEPVLRAGESLVRMRFQRRDANAVRQGPPVAPQAADQFELFCDPATGQARELVYTLASSALQRRVRLEDWRRVRDDVALQVPFRRVYLDAQSRPTLVLEIARCEVRTGVRERDFRLQ